MPIIERYTTLLYDRNSECTSVNDLREALLFIVEKLTIFHPRLMHCDYIPYVSYTKVCMCEDNLCKSSRYFHLYQNEDGFRAHWGGNLITYHFHRCMKPAESIDFVWVQKDMLSTLLMWEGRLAILTIV